MPETTDTLRWPFGMNRPVDGQPLASVTRMLGEPTVFRRRGGYEHGDTFSTLTLTDFASPLSYWDAEHPEGGER